MDRDEALRNISAPQSDVRLRAARALARTAAPEDERILRSRRRLESVPWVRAALERALNRLAAAGAADQSLAGPDELPAARIDYLDAVRRDRERVVHEFRTIIGTLRYWAEREYESYDGSETQRQIDRLRQCLAAIDTLAEVAQYEVLEEFDFSALVADEVASLGTIGHDIQQIGARPFLVLGNYGILALVLRNALHNAAEACGDGYDFFVRWGEGANDYWVAVFDRGVGLPEDAEALFDFGSSTKQHHVGAGLAIVAEAAVALNGEVALTSEADGTTKLEFRWPRPMAGGEHAAATR
jgi:signal transduction histidine kinase